MKKANLKQLFVVFIITFNLLVVSYSQKSNAEERGTRTIFLIRHGQYDKADERDEYTGKGLVPLGIAQSRLLAARLKSMPVEFTSLTSSTMTRAKQTAIIINQDFPKLELNQNKLIVECTPPTWRKDIMAETDSTELSECVENLEKAFQELFIPSPDEKDRNDIIVCHGNVIRYFVTKVMDVNTMAWLQMSISNCSLTIIRIKPDGAMKLDAFSDYGHIPDNMRTYTGGDDESKELIIPK